MGTLDDQDIRDARARATAAFDQVNARTLSPEGVAIIEQLGEAVYAYIRLLRDAGLQDHAIASTVVGAVAGSTHVLLSRA